MNRRGFLKGLGLTATAVAVPSIISSQETIPTFKMNGLYEGDELPIYEEKMKTFINIFEHRVNIAWREKDASKLPINMYQSFRDQITQQYAYSMRNEDYSLLDGEVDNGHIACIKYEFLINEYNRSRDTLSMWKACYRNPKDTHMKKTSFDDFNNKFIELAKEVNLQHRIKRFND